MEDKDSRGYFEQTLPDMEVLGTLANQAEVSTEPKFRRDRGKRRVRSGSTPVIDSVSDLNTQSEEVSVEQTLPLSNEYLTPPKPKKKRATSVAFSTMATPAFWALDGARYNDISPRMLELTNTERLGNFLIDVSRKSINGTTDFSVSYRPDSRRGIRWTSIALTSQEYGLIVHDAPNLANRATSRTQDLHAERGENSFNSLPIAERSAMHQLEAKLESMTAYKDGILEKDLEYLRKFRRGAEHPGRYMGHISEIRTKGDWILKDIVLGRMLEAIRYQRDWREEQMDLATRSMERRLFFERSRNAHIGYWRRVLDLSIEYTGNKNALFNDRIYQTRTTLKTYAQRQEQLQPK